MPIGPNGEKRPADVVANAVHVMRVATGEAEEEYVNRGKSAGGRKGGAARAQALSAERRREIAKEGAVARWESEDDAGHAERDELGSAVDCPVPHGRLDA